MYFKLKDIPFEIADCSVSFDLSSSNQHLLMFIDICAATEDERIPFELREVRLYHNNGFDIGGKTLRNLKGKKFEWTTCTNRSGEEAGCFYVLEHEDVTAGVIEIRDLTKETVSLRWTGTANIHWDDAFGENVPFEAEIEAALPPLPAYKVLNGMKNDRIKLNKDTEFVMLNFNDLLDESRRCLQMWRNDDRQAWEKFDAVLHFQVIHKGKAYDGNAVYKGCATKCTVTLDENCPVQVNITKTALSTLEGQYNFYIAY